MKLLQIQAGEKAHRHILENGLKAADIRAAFGASGAAKWLAIYGLDQAVFSQFLNRSPNPVVLYGTSIGAFKLAAAAQADPASALQRLAYSYIDQSYTGKITPEAIALETQKIIDTLLPDSAVAQILENRKYHFHCGAVRCNGWLASDRIWLQKIAMLRGFIQACSGHKRRSSMYQRTVFGDARSAQIFTGNDGISTHHIGITMDNLKPALLASGSIPVYMQSVKNVDSNQEGIYRDGGLLDYHPIPANLCSLGEGLVIYPHFYPYLIERWFDKIFPWRKAAPEILDNVILVSPSSNYLQSLPENRLPDRNDFIRYRKRDKTRRTQWLEVVERSEELGREWLSLVNSGDIAREVRLIS